MFDIIGYRYIEWVKSHALHIKVFFILFTIFLFLATATSASHAVESSILPSGNDVYYQFNFTSDDVNGDGDYQSATLEYQDLNLPGWQGTDCILFSDYQDTLNYRNSVELSSPVNYQINLIGYTDQSCQNDPTVLLDRNVTTPTMAVPLPNQILDLTTSKAGATSMVTSILPFAVSVLGGIFILLFIIRVFKSLLMPPTMGY